MNVFEANIRLLGGLLSAHLLASDANLGLMQKKYSGELLDLAVDLGDRLMVAFTASPTCKCCTVRTCMLETLLPYVDMTAWLCATDNMVNNFTTRCIHCTLTELQCTQGLQVVGKAACNAQWTQAMHTTCQILQTCVLNHHLMFLGPTQGQQTVKA